MVKQKQLFQEAPTNYAVKKSELMRSKVGSQMFISFNYLQLCKSQTLLSYMTEWVIVLIDA